MISLIKPTSRNASVWISLVLLLVVLAPTPAQAHGYIVRAIPEDRAVLQRAPTRLQYWFSEVLEPAFSKLILHDQTGKVIAEGGVDPNDLSLLTARVPSDLPDGAYIAELRTAFASDGHVIVESQVFFIGEKAGNVAGGETSGDQAVPLEVVWRAILLSSTILLLGVFATYSMVLVPAWGSSKYPAGLLPPRVMSRLNWIVAIALAIAFAGNILALLQQTMAFFGADLSRVLSDQLYNVVRIGTRFGDTWNARMMLLILVAVLFAASIYLRGSQPENVRAFWVANVWGMALVLGTFSVASHAAGSLLLPAIALLSDYLHILATGLWAGGVAALALVAPVALQPYSGEARRQALLAALRRFTRIAAAGLVVVIATGIYNALNWFTTPSDLVTSYGGALFLKLIFVALLVGVGAAHHIAVNPERYQRWSGVIARVNNLMPTLRLEAVLVVVVLIAVGYLSATPIPQPELVGQTAPPPSATQQVDGYDITTSITPGGPGINTYDVEIKQDGKPVDGLTVSLRMSEPSRDLRSDWHSLESVGDGLYASVGDDIIRSGEWWTVVDIGTTRAAFDWQISEDASVINSRAPTLLNWLALAGGIVALIYAASPMLRHFYHWLDLTPESVTIALGAGAITLVIAVIGVWLAAQAGEQTDLNANPPPKVVNAVLPSATSLERGQALYETACAAWQSAGDAQELIKRLPRLRDEDLYAAVTSDGWWSLPPCQGDYTEAQWWDVVNYIRSLEPVSGT